MAVSQGPQSGEIEVKRDMEMVRQILLEIESTDKCVFDFGETGEKSVTMLNRPHNMARFVYELQERGGVVDPEVAERFKSKVYCYGLLVNEGWIVEANEWRIENLSWEAHDFLDAMRDDSRWSRVKQYVKDRGEDASMMPFSTLKAIGEKLLTNFMESGV